ncbi:hypothetical protein NLI96_g11472 [Meripilus lineatus]|uniref:BCD1 alpha/beta domain-containing protein n=1 Tax=Meripilus lineatus TaxID=2056292 RepID=A0AAD5Y940_9APHY|nr:hypothetical protein NLI96_g11472 [Physisporinus lineatus]
MDRPKSKKDSYPQWLTDMILPPPEDSNPESFVRPTCVMPTRVDPLASLQQSRGNSIGNGSFSFLRPGHIVREGFYKLDPETTLSEALKHKEFVEFPTIEVWEDGAFTGTIVDDRGAVLLDSDEERKPKRRKMGAKEGKKAISGLLGGYGSGSEDEEAEEQNVLNALAGYTGSEDEDDDMQGSSDTAKSLRPGEVWLKEEDLVDEDAEGETDDEEYEEENVEDLAGILEKLRQAGALRDPVDSSFLDGQGDDDQVDWGDSDNET